MSLQELRIISTIAWMRIAIIYSCRAQDLKYMCEWSMKKMVNKVAVHLRVSRLQVWCLVESPSVIVSV